MMSFVCSCRNKTDRMPHSRGLKKADLVVKDFWLAGVRDVIIDVSLSNEFHGSCADPMRNGKASHADSDINGALDAAVKVKLDNYQRDYNERNFLFLPAVMTTSGRISGDFLRLLYLAYYPTAKQRTTSHEWASSIPPPRHTNNVGARTSTTTAPPGLPERKRPNPSPAGDSSLVLQHSSEERERPNPAPSALTQDFRSRPVGPPRWPKL